MRGPRCTGFLNGGKRSINSGKCWTMTKRRTWRIKSQGPGATNEPPLRPTIHPLLVVHLATLLQPTVWLKELATPQAPCLTTTVLIPSCIYSAIWGLMNREATLAQTESSSWESQPSERRNLEGLIIATWEWERNSEAEEAGVPSALHSTPLLSHTPRVVHSCIAQEATGQPGMTCRGRAAHNCRKRGPVCGSHQKVEHNMCNTD